MEIIVVKSGPVFDGRAAKQLDNACNEIGRRVATLGAATIRAEQHATFKHETPYYRLQNEARQVPPNWEIWDRGVIYGPWLEGIGSRNFPKTRFRGYAIYRRLTQVIDRRAGNIAEYTIRQFLPGMSD